MWIVTSLSQYITASEGDEMYRSFINCFIQVSSLVVVARARYSAFTEDRETIDCYFTFQDIKASPMNMQKPMVDFRESIHDAQSASLNVFD